jgi:hypothetical protein
MYISKTSLEYLSASLRNYQVIKQKLKDRDYFSVLLYILRYRIARA